MGPLTIMARIKSCLEWIGWKLFIWAYPGTKDDFFNEVYMNVKYDLEEGANDA